MSALLNKTTPGVTKGAFTYTLCECVRVCAFGPPLRPRERLFERSEEKKELREQCEGRIMNRERMETLRKGSV